MTQNKKQPSNNSRKLKRALARLAKMQGVVDAIRDAQTELERARDAVVTAEDACAVYRLSFQKTAEKLGMRTDYHPDGAIAVLKAEAFDAMEEKKP